MDIGNSNGSERMRLNETQLKQRIIHLNAELAKYKRLVRKYKQLEGYDSFYTISKERDELLVALHEHKELINELQHQQSELLKEKENISKKYEELLNGTTDDSKEQSGEASGRLEQLEGKLGSFVQEIENCMKQYEKNEKRLQNHEKELAKIEMLINNVQVTTKEKLESQLSILKERITMIEEKMKE
jgi:chromosome segregation ATPase